VPETYSTVIASQAAQFLRRTDQVIEPRKQWPGEALAVHEWRGRIHNTLRAAEGRSLCLWGDAGWGELVRRGKQVDGRFDQALVVGARDMIRERWQPDPAPTWVTCVPSERHPALVPDFALRLAQELRLPFVPAVRKLRPTEPQKLMNNSYQQARNIAGAFAVVPWDGMAGPVLLVDDMVDSSWTFTVIAALLRGSGSGPVFPLALAVALAN
jgi:ATP-dependent DNA helicase RecQ